MVWIKGSVVHSHIYLYPSFILKYCPFSLETLEYVWNNCISPCIEPFEIIDDPKELLESSIPLEYHTKKVFNIIKSPAYSSSWNKLYYNTFQTLPDDELPTDILLNISSEYMYGFIKLFADKMNFSLSKYDYLSFANFQIAFK